MLDHAFLGNGFKVCDKINVGKYKAKTSKMIGSVRECLIMHSEGMVLKFAIKSMLVNIIFKHPK